MLIQRSTQAVVVIEAIKLLEGELQQGLRQHLGDVRTTGASRSNA